MGDDQRGAAIAGQAFFQLLDGGDVEMVGRLVHEQDVGVTGKAAGDGRPAQLAARQARGIGLGVEAHLRQLGLGAIAVFQSVGGKIDQRGIGREVRLLGDEGRHAAGLDPDLAGIGLDDPGHKLHQGRLARAVAPDQRAALAFRQRELHAGKQRAPAKGELDIGEGEEGRTGHGSGISCSGA